MKAEIEKILQPESSEKEVNDSLTFSHTANRKFEENWWNDIRYLAHGEFINKDNADCIQDEHTQKLLP